MVKDTDSKSTCTGRLLFELGGIGEREMQKLREEADRLGKSSFAFAFYMDRQKDERERGVTIACTTKEFFTDNYHYTIIDAPGHRDFIKNMITGASQADVALLMVPADGNFGTSIARGSHKGGEIQGQTRQHARILNLLGVKQLIIGVNKMDSDTAKYSQERYNEVAAEMRSMLTSVGWPKKFVQNRVPIIPISGYNGDNLIKESENMGWWKGVDVNIAPGKKVHVHTLLDALNTMVQVPKRNMEGAVRVPISGIYKIKGVGDVLTGRVEQGKISPGDEVKFVPTHTAANDCCGKVFTVEMHHKQVEFAGPGDNVGMNIKGLVKNNMPKVGDVLVLKNDDGIKPAKRFEATVQFLDIPGEIKVGYTPIGYVRTARAPLKIVEIKWRSGKETGGQEVPNPISVKRGDRACCVFEPQKPFTCDTKDNCLPLSRLALLEGHSVVALGVVNSIN